jgi:hypothetical protein
LLPVYQNQRVHFAFHNQPSGNGSLSECRRRAKDTLIVRADAGNSLFLELA